MLFCLILKAHKENSLIFHTIILNFTVHFYVYVNKKETKVYKLFTI